MRILLFFILFFTAIKAQNVDCTMIFEARKSEIQNELLKIDEQRQSLEAYKASILNLNRQNLEMLEKKRQEQNEFFYKKELDINETLSKITQKEQNIAQMLEKNEKILEELKSMTNDKISETYSKMKDQVAADVLTQMGINDAAKIMYSLSAKKIAAILAKMDPGFASDLTLVLRDGPPFENKTLLDSDNPDKNSTQNLGAQSK